MAKTISLVEKRVEKEDPRGFKERTKRIVEALLFSSPQPLSSERMHSIATLSHPVEMEEIETALRELKAEYERENRSFELIENSSGYLLKTRGPYARFVEELSLSSQSSRLSKAATEVLAIIAHRFPITRSEIEKIRGVDCSGALASLMERELIEVVGRLDSPGRPSQYGITKAFLEHFGLKCLSELKKN